MNNKIKKIAKHAGWQDDTQFASWNKIHQWENFDKEKFAELIVAEVRDVLTREYLDTPLECCGHFLRLDEAILDHFYSNEDAPKT